ncbi:MAG TPA: hypothetical protein VJX47_13950 [Candidatus Sulfotelmatobacter sp.]|nr:hypothetical protein [Candidatus Sulfotelmatobacter sp.]
MRFFSLFLTFVVLALIVAKADAQTRCSKKQYKQASDKADQLGSWDSARDFYRQYRQCDDGGIGEGVSDAVTTLLANHWDDFPKLVVISTANPGFEKFVLRHIDATVPVETLQSISKNARGRCPQKAAGLCKMIAAAASSAIKESEK